jgi:hypothetical protein
VLASTTTTPTAATSDRPRNAPRYHIALTPIQPGGPPGRL